MRTLYTVFPEIKAFGCCHEVFHIQGLLAKILELECGIKEVTKNEISINVMGVNHFAWVDKASYNTIDLMPIFDSFAAKYSESGFALNEHDKDVENPFRNNNKVCFDMYRRYRLIPAAGDRHLAEFMPPLYLENPDSVERFGFELTKVSYRKKLHLEKIKQTDEILSGQSSFKIKPSGEEGSEQIKALLGISKVISTVNLPNQGQIENLPIGAVVETNSLFQKNTVAPLYSAKLPPLVCTMVKKHDENQK